MPKKMSMTEGFKTKLINLGLEEADIAALETLGWVNEGILGSISIEEMERKLPASDGWTDGHYRALKNLGASPILAPPPPADPTSTPTTTPTVAQGSNKGKKGNKVEMTPKSVFPGLIPPSYFACSLCNLDITEAARRMRKQVDEIDFCPHCLCRFVEEKQEHCPVCSDTIASDGQCLNGSCGALTKGDKGLEQHVLAFVVETRSKGGHWTGKELVRHARVQVGAMEPDEKSELLERVREGQLIEKARKGQFPF